MAQPGSATVLGTVGRWFKSNRPDHSQCGATWLSALQFCFWNWCRRELKLGLRGSASLALALIQSKIERRQDR